MAWTFKADLRVCRSFCIQRIRWMKRCSLLHPKISLGSMCVDVSTQCSLIHRTALNNPKPSPESVIYKGKSHDSAGVLVSAWEWGNLKISFTWWVWKETHGWWGSPTQRKLFSCCQCPGSLCGADVKLIAKPISLSCPLEKLWVSADTQRR